MTISSNIFIVGPMGAGKTTIGRHLAKVLEKQFKDSDREIEKRTGADIPLIFELEGEAGFRRREKAVMAELTEGENLVLATGGGAVLDRDNRSRLVKCGFVIYLQAPLDQLVERTSRDRNRPLLQTEDPRARLATILAERDPLYRQVADLIVKTDHRTVRSVVKEIHKRLSRL
jgi:shikimate kinase